ncbi:MAG: amidase [Cyanobacteria bacterium J06621_12]
MKPKAPEFVYICSQTDLDNFQHNRSGSLKDLSLGVKDLFQIAGLPTTAGNPDWFRTHPIPEATAPSVTALLEAGVTLVGKTLTDELAYSLEGVNLHYGTPINPQAPLRLPGGSSSGSAVAVGNGSVDLSLGTDTGGSIRVPASYNGIYGFRPSHGLVNCDLLIPLSPRFDTVGWLARDIATIKQVGKVLLPATTARVLSHLVVANIEGLASWQTARQPLLDRWSDQFKSLQQVELTENLLTNASHAFRILQGREIWRIHGQWIEQQQPQFAPEISDRFDWCRTLTKDDELQAEVAAQEFVNHWQQEVLPTPNHVLLMPTTPGAAPLLITPATELRRYRQHLMSLTAPAGLTGAPQISLPYLQAQQAPWGVSLLASSGSDRTLLNCAAKLDLLLEAKF